MNLTARVTTVWTGGASAEWQQLRDAKINEMTTSGKTDGILVQENDAATDGVVFHRDFIDSAAAQEFVDWWTATEVSDFANITLSTI